VPEIYSAFSLDPQKDVAVAVHLRSYRAFLDSTGAESDSALFPLKNFIFKVLKRYRTLAMQTALCYLEAICPKVVYYALIQPSGQSCADGFAKF